jgi:hypothetical protein
MIYRYLSEIGDRFYDEVGDSGQRENLLYKLESKLTDFIIDLRREQDALKAPVAKVASGRSLQDRVAFFDAKGESVTNVVRAGRIKKLQEQVALERAWLERQGAVVDADGNVDWGRTKRVVQYDQTYAQMGMTMVHFSGGRLFTDKACAQPLDTKGMVTHFSGPGYAIYVMGRTGNIHVSSHMVGHRHHSSLLAGTDVAGAGELQVDRGNLRWLSNKSGHYAPSVVHLVQTLHQLQKKGVPMTFQLRLIGGKKHRYASVGDLLQELKLDDRNYELAKLLAYKDYLNDSTLGQNGWRWRREGEPSGVYSVTTNQPVPHKEVRQWLKSIGRRASTQVQSGVGRNG